MGVLKDLLGWIDAPTGNSAIATDTIPDSVAAIQNKLAQHDSDIQTELARILVLDAEQRAKLQRLRKLHREAPNRNTS